MYDEIDDMFPDTESYLTPPSYLGKCVGDEGNEVMREIELMGYDISDNELLMSGPFKRLFKRIQKRVRARREARAKKAAMSELGPEGASAATAPAMGPQFSLQTSQGQVGYGPGGFQYTTPQTQGQIGPSRPVTGAGFMQDPMGAIQRNPMLLAIPLGLVFLAMVMKK